MKAISTLAIAAIVIIVIAAIGAAAYFIIHHSSSTTTPTTSSPITLTVVTFSGLSAQFIQYAGELFHQLHPNVQV
ncbi:MAG: carbohydrate ABC transporter substrate-binding protein, partial [Saccharolobus sp.]